MERTRGEVLRIARRRGVFAAVSGASAVAAAVVIGAGTGLVLAVPAALLTASWWRFRAQNGIRF